MTLEQLQEMIKTGDLESVVRTHILGAPSSHFDQSKIGRVREVLGAKYGVQLEAADVHIVGSAKLGYALFDKWEQGAQLRAFRAFRPGSDIDVAITSQDIFEKVWADLAVFVNGKSKIPWDSGQLGDYFLYGWIRPDHFPKGARIQKCDDWWDAFRFLSSDVTLGRRKIRGALYFSVDHLVRYQVRSLQKCRSNLERMA